MSRSAQHGLRMFADALSARGGALWRERRRGAVGGCQQTLVSLLLAVSFLVGCGWHLRGSGGGGLEGANIYLLPKMGVGELSKATADALRRYGAEIVGKRQAADWVLVLLDQQMDRRTVSVTPGGEARAYELSYRLRFRVESGAGAVLLGEQAVAPQVVYPVDPRDILGSESQARRLTEQLRHQALERMMARLANIPPS